MNQSPLTSKSIKEIFDSFKESRTTSFCGYQIPIIENNLFPFEAHYPACDIETKQEIRIPSGEMIHGVFVDGKGYVSPLMIEKLKEIPKTNEL